MIAWGDDEVKGTGEQIKREPWRAAVVENCGSKGEFINHLNLGANLIRLIL